MIVPAFTDVRIFMALTSSDGLDRDSHGRPRPGLGTVSVDDRRNRLASFHRCANLHGIHLLAATTRFPLRICRYVPHRIAPAFTDVRTFMVQTPFRSYYTLQRAHLPDSSSPV